MVIIWNNMCGQRIYILLQIFWTNFKLQLEILSTHIIPDYDHNNLNILIVLIYLMDLYSFLSMS